ncbi:virulence RhuM family protein [Vibrio parahaemolyticus]|nr:virulence RhuM family protein [Vibrio parahaemolyticus]
MIIAISYRVRSVLGTQLRQCATQTPEQYLIKGFVMDDEWRVYLRVEEIFTLAADYEPSNKETTRFFQTIQNKLHFA